MAKPSNPAPKQSIAKRLAHDPALRAKYLANPGLRAKYVPDSMLPPALRAQRQQAALGRQPITEGSSITNKQLNTQATTAVNAQYLPAEQAQAKAVTQAVTSLVLV